ncbi:MAG: FUSC family membrane protein [Salegentibacter sp.]
MFRLLRSPDFSKAIILMLSLVIPIFVFSELGLAGIGIAIATGCLFTSPADVTGSFRHRTLGLLIAAFLAAASVMIIGYASVNMYALIPVLGILVFAVSYLAVYGFRASLVSFAGLLAIVLSFANASSTMPVWEHALLVACGGLWYLSLSTSWRLIRPQRQTEQLLAEAFLLTGQYLKLRSRLAVAQDGRSQLFQEISLLQTQLNEKHESLRELLISSRRNSGNSNYARKRLLVLVELIDIYEIAFSHPLNYTEMDRLFQEAPGQVLSLSELIFGIGGGLEEMGEALEKNRKIPESEIGLLLKKAEQSIDDYKQQNSIVEKRQFLLLLRNLFDYQQKQVQKLEDIFRILRNMENPRRLFIRKKEAVKFLSPQDYSPRLLAENFDFNSPVFRHALRLSVLVLLGFSLGAYFSIQNAYWILITIIVIMRPGYGLTKERTRQRIVGTLIGGAVAVGIVLLTQNSTIFAILALLSLVLAFSFIQRNYRTAAVFITLSIIFIYALMKPDIMGVIKYRVLDTLAGAVIAILGNIFLWPAWQARSIKEVIAESISANAAYLHEISRFYRNKGLLPVSYKLARKKAFLEIGNLSAAFQRMAQEPKSKQLFMAETYKLVELNQSFMAALASLGTYVQNHKTTEASEDFNVYINHICEILKIAEDNLKDLPGEIDKTSTDIDAASEALEERYKSLVNLRNAEIEAGKTEIDRNMRVELQEAQLILGQLQWLLEISQSITEVTTEFKDKNTNSQKSGI